MFLYVAFFDSADAQKGWNELMDKLEGRWDNQYELCFNFTMSLTQRRFRVKALAKTFFYKFMQNCT